MAEKRKNQRLRTLKGGAISFVGGVPIECVIRNMSDAGACLELSNPALPPENFTLIIKPELLTRSCQVVWRSSNRIGVRYK